MTDNRTTGSGGHDLLAATVRESAGALAAYAAHDLLGARPAAAAAYEPRPAAGWRGFLAKRLADLAAAAAAEAPALFVAQVGWARAGFAARGVPTDHLRAALDYLGQVLDRELPAAARPVAREYLSLAQDALERRTDEAEPGLAPDSPQGRLALAYVLALLEGDGRRAAGLLLDAARDGWTVRDLYLEVLIPALRETGRMWLVGEICVAEEHFITATTASLVHRLLAAAPTAEPNGKTAVVAAVAGNRHDLAAQMLANLLEMEGWRVIRLGADVPVADVAMAVREFDADGLLLSASLATHMEALARTVRAVRDGAAGTGVKILVGGAAFGPAPTLADRLGADAYAAGIDEATAAAARLVGLPTPTEP
jgi:methanogenic corrinoid protein MtbC1